MSCWYGLDGEEIGPEEWKALFNDPARLLKQEVLPNGVYVSTVWLGLDHRFGARADRPLIFETMVFPSRHDPRDLDVRRYATLEEALAGHAEMVAKWSADA